MLDIGRTYYRLSEYDIPELYATHIAKAKSIAEAIRENTSEIMFPDYYEGSAALLANFYFDRRFASSHTEYRANLEISLKLNNAGLKLISKIYQPVRWGVYQHNIGLIYTRLFKFWVDKCQSIDLINKAINYLELSFQVRDPESADDLQYWVASCRSLGEALIERSMCVTRERAQDDIGRAFEFLSKAASKISEYEHPNQWAEIQEQLARCTNRRLRLPSKKKNEKKDDSRV
jgi:hypothetical protein